MGVLVGLVVEYACVVYAIYAHLAVTMNDVVVW
jgi:hypothetical protein